VGVKLLDIASTDPPPPNPLPSGEGELFLVLKFNVGTPLHPELCLGSQGRRLNNLLK
jgi:hypothetical protein